MPTFKIASWNVNSLRVRLPQLLLWLETNKPDVVALQETKLPCNDFPFEIIERAGYHVVASGQKAYNGVAVLSREKIENILVDLPGEPDPQRRVLGVSIGEIRVLNLYIPNGQHVSSSKFEYKLNWLKNLHTLLKLELMQYPKMIVLGDFNIAPEEIDVHDPKRWEGQVLFSEPERQAFRNILQVGFHDCYRQINPQEKNFTWWDYRLNAFQRNMGMRIDHILASLPLKDQCTRCEIDKHPRAWERPSDHAVVLAEFQV